MEKILKVVNTNKGMTKKEIFKLLETNSQKINSEISKKIKSFDKIDDFVNRYSNKTPLLEFFNKIGSNSSQNYDDDFLSFDSNIEQYISCFTQIIISLKLVFKIQEILNKIFLSSKKKLSKLKNEQHIENISQKNIFLFIEKLLDISREKTLCKLPNTFSVIRRNSSVSPNDNKLNYRKFISDQTLESLYINDFEKNLKIVYEEPLTPKFGSNSDKNSENVKNENHHNICIRKDSSFTLSGDEEINTLKDNSDIIKSKVSNSIIVYKNEKKYEKLLEMINSIYRKGIINSEEKIILKQLVIAKSKKIENLYYNTYKSKGIDETVLRTEISKLLN